MHVMNIDMQKLYDKRFQNKSKRRKKAIWKVICEYLTLKYMGGGINIVVDIAAGYCDFINNIDWKCQKYALDVNVDVKKYAGKDVNVFVDSIENLDAYFANGTVSLFFMSNFLEHITKDMISCLLKKEYDLLDESGEVWILTPNIRYVGGKYWDFYDHITPITEKSLIEQAELIGYKVKECVPKFLPYTTKGIIPQSPWIVRLYLMLMPLSGMIFGEQSFLILKK